MNKSQLGISVLQIFPVSGEKAYITVIKMLEDRMWDIAAILNELQEPQIREIFIRTWQSDATINEFIIEGEDS